VFYLTNSGWTVDVNYDNGSILSAQRDKIMRAAQKEEMDLLFVDSDMVFDHSAIESILACGQGDLIGAMCFMRRFPFQPCVFAEDKVDDEHVFTGMKLKDMPSYPFECAAVGCAFLYVPMGTINTIFKGYEHPFNNYEMKNGECLGEDLSFFYRCNKLGLISICVPNVEIGHITERIITRKDHEAALGFVNKQKVSAALP
jgi:hypothetical protein